MKKHIALLFLLCAALLSCDSGEMENIDTSFVTTQEITVETTAQMTEVTTIETIETTVETIAETTVETTAETIAETTVTTADTTKQTEPKFVATVPRASVLEGEYTYGGESVIEVIDGLTYVNGILVVNKTYTLPDSYDPGGLAPDAKAAFERMKADAAAEGLTLKIVSGYRSYRQQVSTYGTYYGRDGAVADRYSARPGHSEHQSGYAMDINSVYKSFANTAEGKWLAANCMNYGFIIRYPEEKEEITGFMYEPWHIRYLGVETAKLVSESGLCLEEFLGITSVYAE